MELISKAQALKDLPGRKLTIMQNFRGQSLKSCIAILRRASDMNIVNDISEAQYGVSEITQLLPTGNMLSWRRSQDPDEPVQQG